MLNEMSSAIKKLSEDGLKSFFHESLAFLIRRLRGRDAELKYRSYAVYIKNRVRYPSIADPLDPIEVNPQTIKYRSLNIPFDRCLGKIISGDWDKSDSLVLIKDMNIVSGLEERFIENKKWEHTKYVEEYAYYIDNDDERYNKKKIDQFIDKRGNYGCGSIDEFINKRCTFIDNLYSDIKNNGYKPEHSTKKNNVFSNSNSLKQELDPLVLIGRDGEIIWRDGVHRFTIARILNISPIPVLVVARHEKWQMKREEIQSKGFGEKYRHLKDHPDVQDLN